MALNVGELQATLGLKDKNFSSGINQATQNIQNFSNKASDSMYQAENAVQNLDNTTDDLSKSTDNLSKVIQTTNDKAGDFADTINDTSQKLDEASDAAEHTGDQIEETGKQADKSSGFLGDMKAVLGAIGITVGISELISQIKKIGDAALKAADDYDNAMKSIIISTGSFTNSQEYASIAESITRRTGMAGAESAIGTLATYYPGLSTDELSALTESYLQFAKATNTDVTSAIENVSPVFAKWNIDAEKQSGTLEYLSKVTMATGVSIKDLTNLLSDGDYAFQVLNMGLETAAAYIGSEWVREKDLSDVTNLLNTIERVNIQFASTLGSEQAAQGFIQGIIKSAQEFDNFTQAVGFLQKELGIDDKSAGIFAKTFDKTNDVLDETKDRIDKVEVSLSDMSTTLTTVEEQGTRMGKNLGELFSGVGNAMQSVRDNLDAILQNASSDKLQTFADLLYVRGWLGGNDINQVSPESMNNAQIAQQYPNLAVYLTAPDADQYTIYTNNEKAKVNMVKK